MDLRRRALLAASLGYLQHAHQLITDNALMAGIAMGMYGLAAANGFWLGLGAGVAFLSKGLVGPGLLGLTAVLLVVLPAWRQSWRAWPMALLAFVPFALIWPWLLHQRSAALFQEWFWVNNFGRFTGEAGLGGVLDHLHYAKALVWFALPAQRYVDPMPEKQRGLPRPLPHLPSFFRRHPVEHPHHGRLPTVTWAVTESRGLVTLGGSGGRPPG